MSATVLILITCAAVVASWVPVRRWYRHWGATRDERVRTMAGDCYVAEPNYETTLAVRIDVPAAEIWPWLVQMGYRRGGLYSYDWLDRLFGFLDAPSAERILPEFQHLAPGDVIPIGRGGDFPVLRVDPLRSLILGGAAGDMVWIWELALYPVGPRCTRLVSRNRARIPAGPGWVLFMLLLDPAAFIMTRGMLRGLKRRAESADALLGTRRWLRQASA